MSTEDERGTDLLFCLYTRSGTKENAGLLGAAKWSVNPALHSIESYELPSDLRLAYSAVSWVKNEATLHGFNMAMDRVLRLLDRVFKTRAVNILRLRLTTSTLHADIETDGAPLPTQDEWNIELTVTINEISSLITEWNKRM